MKYPNMARNQPKGPRNYDRVGDDLPFAKITATEMREIRADLATSKRALGRRYGISHCQVIAIQKGRRWGRVK